jgi:hypothetical protein
LNKLDTLSENQIILLKKDLWCENHRKGICNVRYGLVERNNKNKNLNSGKNIHKYSFRRFKSTQHTTICGLPNNVHEASEKFHSFDKK